MNKLEILGLHVEHIYNPRLKNSYINILPSAKIVVKTPTESQAHIQDLIKSKYDWIVKKINHIEKYQQVKVNLEDEVLLFGELYSVDHEMAQRLREKLFRLKILTPENLLRIYDSYYKEMAEEYIPKRVEYFSHLMGLYPSNIKFRKMKRRWGSCDSNRELTFNIYLLKLSTELIDYVIVHELSHLKHMNHSKRFHTLVESHLHDAKLREKKIKEEYYKFMLE
jgi:hypothetical protein